MLIARASIGVAMTCSRCSLWTMFGRGASQQATSPSNAPAGYWTTDTGPPVKDREGVHQLAACDALVAPATQLGIASTVLPVIWFHWNPVE